MTEKTKISYRKTRIKVDRRIKSKTKVKRKTCIPISNKNQIAIQNKRTEISNKTNKKYT
jgi:hypothetical protein